MVVKIIITEVTQETTMKQNHPGQQTRDQVG